MEEKSSSIDILQDQNWLTMLDWLQINFTETLTFVHGWYVSIEAWPKCMILVDVMCNEYGQWGPFNIPTVRYSEICWNNDTLIFQNPVSFFLHFGSPILRYSNKSMSLDFNIPTVLYSNNIF